MFLGIVNVADEISTAFWSQYILVHFYLSSKIMESSQFFSLEWLSSDSQFAHHRLSPIESTRSTFLPDYSLVIIIMLALIIVFIISGKTFAKICSHNTQNLRQDRNIQWWLATKRTAAGTGQNPQSQETDISIEQNKTIAAPAHICDCDLECCKWHIDTPGGDHTEAGWSEVICRRNEFVSYQAKRRVPTRGGTEYLSSTRFENCNGDLLCNFYMDGNFSVQWDSIVKSYVHLSTCEATGIQTGVFVKDYGPLGKREYVQAWKVWKMGPGTFYCVTKAVDHPSAPRVPGIKRVTKYICTWKITDIPEESAAVVSLYTQEENGIPGILSNMAFSAGIWNYVQLSERSLRQYSLIQRSIPAAVSLATEVPGYLLPGAENYPSFEGRTHDFRFRSQNGCHVSQAGVEAVLQEDVRVPIIFGSPLTRICRFVRRRTWRFPHLVTACMAISSPIPITAKAVVGVILYLQVRRPDPSSVDE